MTKQDFEDLLEELLRRGFCITMTLEDGCRWYDLHTRMKSHLHIAYVDGRCIWRGRYDKRGEIEDLRHLRVVGESCMWGRDYASAFWHDFLKESELISE